MQEEFARQVAEYPVASFNLRMLKAGRTHYLLAHVVLAPQISIESIHSLDKMRRKITSGMKSLHPPWEVDIVFVGDESLA